MPRRAAPAVDRWRTFRRTTSLAAAALSRDADARSLRLQAQAASRTELR